MWSSGVGDMSAVGAMFESGPFLCERLASAGLGWGEQGDEAANRGHGVSSQDDVGGRALARVKRLKVADSLRLSQRAECIEFPRDRHIGLHRIDQFEEQTAVWASLCSCPVECKYRGP